MLKYYVKTTEALKRLRTDEAGVVSFEYIIVACCIIAAVAAVFGGTGAGTIAGTLKDGLANITTAFSTALP
jgi:pilus assembly protein Flp/PilA